MRFIERAVDFWGYLNCIILTTSNQHLYKLWSEKYSILQCFGRTWRSVRFIKLSLMNDK